MHNWRKQELKMVRMGMLQRVNIYSQFSNYIFAHKLRSVQNVQKYAVKHILGLIRYIIGSWV